ncbi:MAG: mevalonate kinase [Pseudomonadota bacterium]
MAATLTASAPGSTLITGEHAVLHGHRAIVCAIAQRATAQITALNVRELRITSEIAEPARLPLDAMVAEGPYRFVIAAVLSMAPLEHGFGIDIRSEIDPTLGFGSSAAVTVAVLFGLQALRGGDVDRFACHSAAVSIIREIQGRGSGADLAASLFGGMLTYRAPHGRDTLAEISPLPAPPAISLRYAGYKTPTAEVLARVATAAEVEPTRFAGLYIAMADEAETGIRAAERRDWAALGRSMAAYQELMVALGVSDPTLDRIVAEASGTPGLFGCKISGSGLGDCVLALGAKPTGFAPVDPAPEGVLIHG